MGVGGASHKHFSHFPLPCSSSPPTGLSETLSVGTSGAPRGLCEFLQSGSEGIETRMALLLVELLSLRRWRQRAASAVPWALSLRR